MAERQFVRRLRYRLGRLRATVTDPQTRSDWLTRLRNRHHIHQDTSQTALDRYPALFRQAQRILGRDAPGPILSFGCSSGEEVVTLRTYFPTARLYGTDINPSRLAECRARQLDRDVSFFPSRADLVTAHGPYAAIFCLAVLQRRPGEILRQQVGNIAHRYPFALFEAEVARLVGELAPGGLLVAENAQYRVEDTDVARRLDALPGPPSDDPLPPQPYARFARDGHRLPPGTPACRFFRLRDGDDRSTFA